MRTLGTMMLPPSLADLEIFQRRLDEGFHAISRRAFRAILAYTVDASREYADGVWGNFQAAPLGFCTSRSPRSQGEALYAAALAHIRLADRTGRPIGCPGPGRCHEGKTDCTHCGEVLRVCDAPETCSLHHPFDADRIRKAVLGMLTQQSYDTKRRRATIQALIDGMLECALASVASPSPAEILRVLTAMATEGVIVPRGVFTLGVKSGDPPALEVRPDWEGEVQLPLAPQTPGEHAPCCPIVREYWRATAQCDPDLCAYVSPVWTQNPGDSYTAEPAPDSAIPS